MSSKDITAIGSQNYNNINKALLDYLIDAVYAKTPGPAFSDTGYYKIKCKYPKIVREFMKFKIQHDGVKIIIDGRKHIRENMYSSDRIFFNSFNDSTNYLDIEIRDSESHRILYTTSVNLRFTNLIDIVNKLDGLIDQQLLKH